MYEDIFESIRIEAEKRNLKESTTDAYCNSVCYFLRTVNKDISDLTTDDVDAFLFLGEGDFHPLAAAFGVQKDVFVLNPVTREVRDMAETRDRILRKRFAAIQSAKNADSFLVIVCSKVGQDRSSAADEVIEKIRTHGHKAYKAMLEEITPVSLMAYRVDAYVNTACPRVAMDDSARYDRPMLTIPELDIVLGEKEWADYTFDQIRPEQN